MMTVANRPLTPRYMIPASAGKKKSNQRPMMQVLVMRNKILMFGESMKPQKGGKEKGV